MRWNRLRSGAEQTLPGLDDVGRAGAALLAVADGRDRRTSPAGRVARNNSGVNGYNLA